jgi:hypothetical protein
VQERGLAASGKTRDEIGTAMGFTGDVARKSVWQFLNKSSDSRISTRRKFAKAMGNDPRELLS